MQKLSFNDIVDEINKIAYEARNPRNDGYVKSHYKDMLEKLRKIIDEKIKYID
tara:strand:- start:148 stop:306 length:159 start_codon:yes stop_codon:yes gene_type:complete